MMRAMRATFCREVYTFAALAVHIQRCSYGGILYTYTSRACFILTHFWKHFKNDMEAVPVPCFLFLFCSQ
jgi:hypothetical protein